MDKRGGYQECQRILRFWVPVGDEAVEAFLSLTTCEASLKQAPGEGRLADFYQQHQPVLESIVLGKLGAGARRPVVVMACDLQPLAPDPGARQSSRSSGPQASRRILTNSGPP